MITPQKQGAFQASGTLVAYLVSGAERAELLGDPEVQRRTAFFSSMRQFGQAVRDPGTSAAIFELHADAGPDLRAVVVALGQRPTPIPLLVRFELPGAPIK